jgi:hypothetical protein
MWRPKNIAAQMAGTQKRFAFMGATLQQRLRHEKLFYDAPCRAAMLKNPPE